MKRQSLVLLAVVSVAAGAAGCFKDPVSSLRNGPSVFSLDHNAVFILTGDSTTVTAYLEDNGGNQLTVTGATWTSLDPTVAVVRNDTTLPIPGNAFTRGVIRGIITTGGWTYVTVASRGVTDSVRVVILPPLLPASQMSLVGGPAPDTIVIPPSPGPPPVPVDTVSYSTSDTLVINGTGFLNFDTSKVTGYITGAGGSATTFVSAKSPSRISLVVTHGAAGRLVVKNLQFATTNPSIGTQPLDSLVLADSVELARVRYRGAITQTGDTVAFAFTNGIQPFTSSTLVLFGAADTGYVFDPANGKVFARANYNGLVTLKNVGLGAATLDAISTPVATAVTGSLFVLPASTVTQVGDTVTVAGNSLVTIDGSTTIAFGAATGTVLSRGTNTMSVLLGAPSYTGVITAKKALVGVSRIPALTTTGSFTVNQASFLGTLTMLGDTLTITAPAGLTFDSLTSAAFGTGAAIVLSGTSSSLKVLSPVTYTGQVQVTNPLLGTVRVPAMLSPGSVTIAAASFPSANVSVGAGRLGDTITVTAPAGYTFSTSAGSPSMVLAGNLATNTSDTAWVLSRTSSTIEAFAKRGGTGPVRVTNVVIPGPVTVPYLTTPTNFAIDSVASDFPSGPTQGTARVATIPASGVDTVYGMVNATSAPTDYWTFTTTATHTIGANLAWFGSGCPYAQGNCSSGTVSSTTALTADLDLEVCNSVTPCDLTETTPDLLKFAGATTHQPEQGSAAGLPAAQYWAVGIAFTAGTESIVYRMIITTK